MKITLVYFPIKSLLPQLKVLNHLLNQFTMGLWILYCSFMPYMGIGYRHSDMH